MTELVVAMGCRRRVYTHTFKQELVEQLFWRFADRAEKKSNSVPIFRVSLVLISSPCINMVLW